MAVSSPAPTQDPVRQVWGWLAQIPDPEMPAVSIVDLGIVREVSWSGEPADECVVTVTPTYSGCPATEVIAATILSTLAEQGIVGARVRTRLAPAWTTDWLRPEAREQLRRHGIAPPVGCSADLASEKAIDISRLRRDAAPTLIACPHCGSLQTETLSEFGSTPCKALHRCRSCAEPFEYFKCH